MAMVLNLRQHNTSETPGWAGERVLWRGRPRRTLVLERADLPPLVLALVAITLAVVLHQLVSGRTSVFASVFLAVCVCVFAGNGLAPILTRVWRLRRTEYVVTDQRAVAISTAPGQRGQRVVAHTPRSAPAVVRTGADGTGTVVFGALPSPLDAAFGPEWQRKPLVLHHIEHAWQVCELIRQRAAGRR